jgi:hypothetical protein
MCGCCCSSTRWNACPCRSILQSAHRAADCMYVLCNIATVVRNWLETIRSAFSNELYSDIRSVGSVTGTLLLLLRNVRNYSLFSRRRIRDGRAVWLPIAIARQGRFLLRCRQPNVVWGETYMTGETFLAWCVEVCVLVPACPECYACNSFKDVNIPRPISISTAANSLLVTWRDLSWRMEYCCWLVAQSHLRW